MKLQTKFINFFLMLIIIPSLIGAYIYYNVHKYLVVSNHKEMTRSINLTSAILEENLNHISLQSAYLSADYKIGQALAGNDKNLLEKIIQNKLDINYDIKPDCIMLVDKHGNFITQAAKNKNIRLKDKADIIDIISAVAGIRSTEYYLLNNEIYILSYCPVEYNAGIQGAVVFGYKISDIFFISSLNNAELKTSIYPEYSRYMPIDKDRLLKKYKEEVIKKGIVKSVQRKIGKKIYNLIFFPLTNNHKTPIAALSFYFPVTGLAELDKYFTEGIIIFYTLFVALFLSLYLAGHKYFLKPVLLLEIASKKVTKGNLEVSIPVYHSDELGNLTDIFNKMVITLKENKQQLTQTNQELITANQQLESYILTLSHDLKSPVLVSKNFLTLLTENQSSNLTEKQLIYLERIKVNLTKMETLITDILSFFKMGKIKYQWELSGFAFILEEALNSVSDIIDEKNAVINLYHNYPEILCDKERLIIALENLLSNALKYSKPDVPPEIEIGWSENQEEYTFFIKDNGIGIDEIYHKKIFDLFCSLNEIKNDLSTGVGLNIVKKIIEAHGGKIWVESKKSEGSVFYFTIPKKMPPLDYII